MDHFEYLERQKERLDESRMMLGLLSFMALIASLGCFAMASQKTETVSSGHLFWKDERTAIVPTETRLAWLLAGVVLIGIATTLVLTIYRVSARARTDHNEGPQSAESDIANRSPSVAPGNAMQFWVQTAIAILGLLIAAGSAAASWWG